ncbi:MAG TPA: Hsp20/alpha crystallin family protein [Roseiflexaceae bacterium]
MSDLVRWNPFEEMTSLRDAMNQLVAESFVRPHGEAGMFQPSIDLYETEDEYVVKLAAPGLKPDNFEITAQQNMLTIQGRTQAEEQQQEGARYHVREQRFGEFVRTIRFPTQVDTEKTQATLADGILTIRVPKAEAAKPKRITVNVSNGSTVSSASNTSSAS